MVVHLNAYVSYHYAKLLSMIFYQFFAKIFQIILIAILVVAVVRANARLLLRDLLQFLPPGCGLNKIFIKSFYKIVEHLF